MTAQPWPVADASVLAPVPEHEELRTVLRDLLETHAPHDEVRRAAELPEGWSPKLWSLLNEEMDVGSLAVPEERGGQGFGVAVLAVVLEEAGRALLPEPLLLSSVLGVRAVLAAPEGAVPDEVVRGVVEGRLVVTMALEPDADTDLTAGRRRRVRHGLGPGRPGAAGRGGRPAGRGHRTARARVDPPRRPPGATVWSHAPSSRSWTSPAARPDWSWTARRHT